MRRALAASLLLLVACVGDDPTPAGGTTPDGGTPPATPPGTPPVTPPGTPPGTPPPTGNPPPPPPSDAGTTTCTKDFATATFCDDFDTASEPLAGWSVNGNPGTLSTALAFSMPNGMRWATPGGSVKSTAGLSRTIATGTTEWTLQARVHVDTHDATNPGSPLAPPVVLSLSLTSAADQWSFAIDPLTSRAKCFGMGLNPPDAPINIGQWHLISISVKQVGANVALSCQFDGTEVTAPPPTVASHTVSGPATVSVGVVASFAGQGAFSVAEDDVVVVAK